MLAMLGLALGGLALHFAWVSGLGRGEVDQLVDHWVYNGVLALAAAICLLRAYGSPDQRRIWLAFGLGLGAWTAGDIYWTAALADVKNRPYPSPADVGYLLTYPFFYVGVLLMLRRRIRFTASAWLDGAIGGLASAALVTAVLAPALIGLTSGEPAVVATNLSYPVGDILLLSFLIAGVTAAGVRVGRTWLLIGAGIAIWAVADGVYLYQEATSGYDGGYLDGLWLVGGIMIASAAMFSNTDRVESRAASHSIFFPVVFGGLAIGVLAWDHFDRLTTLSVWLSVATLAGVMLRLVLTFRSNVTLLRVVGEEAVTDALTGLRNRRALLADLEQVIAGRSETVLAIFDLDGFKAYNDGFGHPAGDALLQRMGDKLATAAADSEGRAYRLGGDEFCILVPGGSERVDSLLAEAGEALDERGEGFLVTASSGAALLPGEAGSVAEALQLADTRMYQAKGRRQSSAQRQTHDVLTGVLREREPELSEHLSGVARLAVELGREYSFDVEQLDVLTRAAELHDIGKIAIPDRVLHKRGPLDEIEWELMRTHTVTGQRILSAAPALKLVAGLVRSSHERWDGAGYPDGLAGEQIPIGARIIFVCDAYVAMTEERSYRKSRTPGEAIEELRRCAGTQFDPDVVEVMVERVLPRLAAVAGSGSEARTSLV